MKKSTFTILLLLMIFSLVLTACGGNEPEPTEDPQSQADQINAIYTQAAETLQAEIAMTEAAMPEPTNTPQSSPTPQVLVTNTPLPQEETPTAFPTLPALPTPTQMPTQPAAVGGRPCLRAEIAFESPSDGVGMAPGQSFVKQWNLSNSGSCEWTDSFKLIHIRGLNFSDYTSYNLVDVSNLKEGETIENGGLLVIKVSMQAPSTPGSYRSVWMLADEAGTLFGLGTLGKEVFWVDIVVRD